MKFRIDKNELSATYCVTVERQRLTGSKGWCERRRTEAVGKGQVASEVRPLMEVIDEQLTTQDAAQRVEP